MPEAKLVSYEEPNRDGPAIAGLERVEGVVGEVRYRHRLTPENDLTITDTKFVYQAIRAGVYGGRARTRGEKFEADNPLPDDGLKPLNVNAIEAAEQRMREAEPIRLP